MDEQERREFEHDAAEHGIPLMLDRMGMDGLGNEVVSLYKRIIELEAENHDLNAQITKSGVRSREEEAYRDGYNAGVTYSDERVYRAEAALAERNRMLDHIDMQDLAPIRLDGGYARYFSEPGAIHQTQPDFLATLTDRAEEGNNAT